MGATMRSNPEDLLFNKNIEVILQIMKKHKNVAKFQECGFRSLANLAILNANKVTITTLGGIAVIVEAVKNHENVADVQEHGRAALKNLTSNDTVECINTDFTAQLPQKFKI